MEADRGVLEDLPFFLKATPVRLHVHLWEGIPSLFFATNTSFTKESSAGTTLCQQTVAELHPCGCRTFFGFRLEAWQQPKI